MNRFVGFANFKKDISKEKFILEEMKLNKNSFIQKHFVLANLSLEDSENEIKQPISIMYENIIYTIILYGRIYNKSEIKKELINIGYKFIGDSDEEILLKAFIHFGIDIFKKLNGFFSFAIWNNKKEELILVRDHFGIKPLYYTILNNTIIFASEIKEILKYPGVEISLDNIGISEMLGLRSSTYSRNKCI